MSAFWAGSALAVGPGPDGRWHYRRSLASRVILLTTMTVGLAVAFVAVAAYATTRFQMQQSLDNSLMERARRRGEVRRAARRHRRRRSVPSWALGAADVRIAFLSAEGNGRVLDDGPNIELGQPELEVAQGDREFQHPHHPDRWRPLPGRRRADRPAAGLALVIAQPLEDQDRILARLGWVTIAFGGVGVLAAGLAGWLVASNGLRPVRRLTTAVERIARTEDLTPAPGRG